MASKTIKQSVIINASPHEVYEAILDSKKHSDFTGSKAKIDARVHGKFSAWDGYITGENVKLEKDKKIVQKWTCTDLPENYYTKVTFEFKKTDAGTKLIFTQTDVPPENYESLSKGWEDYYWKPLKKFFSK